MVQADELMRYDYRCLDCSTETEWVVFEVQHGMTETPDIKCPECEGSKCERAYIEKGPMGWTRGYGWLDVKGRRRDMNLHTLTNNDPYAGMREKGEADDMAQRLRAGGKRKVDRLRGKKTPLDEEAEKHNNQPAQPPIQIRRIPYEKEKDGI